MKTKHLLFVLSCLLLFSTQAQNNQENNLIADGNDLQQQESFAAAEGEYRKALSINQVNPKAQHNIGNSHYRSKDYAQAYQRYFQSQKNSQDRGEKHLAYHNMGNSFMQQKQYEKAVEAYKNALRNNPTDDETRYNYALAKELLEKQQQEQEQNQDQQDQQDQENQDDKNKDNSEGDQKEKPSDDGEDGDNKDKKDDQKEEDDQEKDKKEQDKDKEQSKGDKQEQKQPPRKPGQLSPEQIKSLLDAMNQQEKNVQDKVNEEKVKGIPVKTKKDW